MSEIKLPARAAAEEHSQFQIEPSEEEVDFRELASVLWAGKWVIIGIAAVVILIGTFYIFLLPPVYQADGSVQVDDGMAGSGSGSPAGNSAMSSLISGGTVEVDAEIQILQSRMIMTQVATAMNLDISAYPRYFPVIGAAMARHHGAGTLQKPLFGLAKYAWGGEQIQVPTLEVPPSLVDVGLKLTATVDGYRVNGLEGRSLLGKVGEPAELDLPDGHFQIFVRTLVARPDTEFTVARVPINNVIGSLQGSLSVSELGKQSGVIALVATGGSADFVTRFIQTLEDEYVRQNVERRSAEAQQSLVFLRGQLPEAKAKVLVAQHALNVYQRAHGSIDVTGETDAVLSQSVAVESAREQLLQSRDLALQKFTDKHPAIHAIDDQLKLLDQREVQVKQRVAELPETQQQILSLRNDLEVSQQLYTDMLNLIQQLQVTRAGTIGSVRIIDRPLPPLGPSKPHRGELLGGVILLAFVLGCGYVLAMYLLQQGVEDPGELERESAW